MELPEGGRVASDSGLNTCGRLTLRRRSTGCGRGVIVKFQPKSLAEQVLLEVHTTTNASRNDSHQFG
jgi:hypothetical protein